jgi:hypothetical protein
MGPYFHTPKNRSNPRWKREQKAFSLFERPIPSIVPQVFLPNGSHSNAMRGNISSHRVSSLLSLFFLLTFGSFQIIRFCFSSTMHPVEYSRRNILAYYDKSGAIDLNRLPGAWPESTNQRTGLTDERAMELLRLRDMAISSKLHHLSEKIEDILLGQGLSSWTAVLEDLLHRGETDGIFWFRIMLGMAVSGLWLAICPCKAGNTGIAGCSFRLLEKIFWSIQGNETDPESLVALLKQWHKTHKESATKEELSRLRVLGEAVNLESMEAHQFVQIEACPVFPIERLFPSAIAHLEKMALSTEETFEPRTEVTLLERWKFHTAGDFCGALKKRKFGNGLEQKP